ncbi:MAG: cyclic nucleotide-binding domain-containing protein [Collinsella sp.]
MDVDEATLAVLKKSPVFAGIDPAELPGLLRALGAYTRSFSKGEAVFRSGDKLKAVPVVLKGRIEARMLGKDGSRQIISRFEVGRFLCRGGPHGGGDGTR